MAELDDSCMVVHPIAYQSELGYTIHQWSKKFDSKSLKAIDFYHYWSANVPRIYSPRPGCDCLNLTFDENLAKSVLFEPLEQFVCNDKNSEKVFEELKKLNDPPSLCGKVFKMGEPTYSCRDCGLDPTCVLCVDCFKSSEHKSHRYKMSMSNGGGYCDCGDKEAWKAHPFCRLHLLAKNQGDGSDSGETVLDRLPTDIVERLRLVMQVTLQYCHRMLTWESALNLPSELQPPGSDSLHTDVYATVLYNDEIHTYEQVIQTLTRAIACNHKQAIEYATTIDREGRSIVKCADMGTCTQIQGTVSRVTSRHGNHPLKTVVMHTVVIAHQIFAMRLLSWMQQILLRSEGFRLILSNVMMEPQESHAGAPFLEMVMQSDTNLWKTARNQWHQLFITGMLMDQHSKKAFAEVFTRNYSELMAAFSGDDHEHSVSVTSLAVQIFTVPTLAHYLIEKDALFLLLRTFNNEASHFKNKDNKLFFEKAATNMRFRRAQYILYDLKYLLMVVPEEWSDPMKKAFRMAFQSFLTLLGWMQGMDSVVRQVGQHVEFEAEWESGINLQFKLFPILCLIIEWSSSNRTVLVKTLRTALKYLQTLQTKHTFKVEELANHSANCIDYEVQSMPVTVHLPVSRLVAGLLLHLYKYDLAYDSPEFSLSMKCTPEELMELPLRCLVMVSQFRVGMWRRNGYSLLNQVYFYHNVRLREEMYDRDIQMLQIAASLIESNEFLIHLLNKFALVKWFKDTSDSIRKPEDESLRPIVSLAEEFLSLVLTIISERHTPGIGKVTEAEKIQKEIIQLLSMESMPHSQLLKMLPKDSNHETGMEDVISKVANFRKPQGSNTGKYELKPEFFKDFNPFFYHYSREEQSRAQEVQLKRKKQAGEEECCPPPVPPEFMPNFVIANNLLQCDVMMHIMKQVLRRALDLQSQLFSDIQVEKLLHLIGVALHEEVRLLKESPNVPHFFSFTSKARKEGILTFLQDCLQCPRIDGQKDLLKFILKQFKNVENLSTHEGGESSKYTSVEVAGHSSTHDNSADERKLGAEKAAARRTRIMAQMANMQKNFIKKYADLFDETANDDSGGVVMEEVQEEKVTNPIAIGRNQCGRYIKPEIHTCILCRENQEVSSVGRTLVMSAYVQRSMVLSKNRRSHQLEDPDGYDPLLLPADLFCGPHTSTCGHVMHSDCWQKFFDSVLLKERRRPLRYGRHISFNVDKNEFLCPLCERLSNTVIPMVPAISSLVPDEMFSSFDIGIDDWLTMIRKAVEKVQVHRLKDPASDDSGERFLYRFKPTSLAEIAAGLPKLVTDQYQALFAMYQTCSLIHGPSSTTDEQGYATAMSEMMKLFTQSTYTVGLGVNPHSEDDRLPLLSWWSLAYTIHSIEWLLRDQGKPLFGSLSFCQDHCLSALTRCIANCIRIFDSQVVRSHCVRLLRYLLLGEHYLSSPFSIIEVDAFGLLVSLTMALPSLYMNEENSSTGTFNTENGIFNVAITSLGNGSNPFPLGNAMDFCVLQLVYTFHLVQVLLTKDFVDETNDEEADAMEVDEVVSASDENTSNEPKLDCDIVLLNFYQELITAAGIYNRKSPSVEALRKTVKEGTTPFLRCAATFFHYVTDVIAPPDLLDGAFSGDIYEVLCQYLSLPTTIGEFLQSSLLRQLALSWARHARVHYLVNEDLKEQTLMPVDETEWSSPDNKKIQKTNLVIKHPVPVNQLIQLPDDYSELINNVSMFTCPNSEGDDCRSPTMCLVCGAILCSQSYCCQIELDGHNMVGACTNHTISCGAGTGVFLRVRDCKVLLLTSLTKGCFVPPPYVDDYGETDQGLQRGNPLHLCQDRYKDLHRMWLSHSIPEQIAHALELSATMSGNNWQLM